MAGDLDEYRRKRDFSRTPEPVPRPTGGAENPEARFVVHRHEARRLHYDLRLESGGVLRSWAVPRGFSYAPSTKRLAMRTEDHPLEYLTFSGVIPKGQYGAGTMTVWDEGIYEDVVGCGLSEGLVKGELKLRLRGRRLRGEWHLVRTRAAERGGGEPWLLFKSHDRYAGPDRDSVLGISLQGVPRAEPFSPREFRPMSPDGETAPFSDPEWLFEADFDGARVLLTYAHDRLQAYATAGAMPGGFRVLDLGAFAPPLAAERAILDGVLVAADEHGRPSREALERALARGREGMVCYVFDLLYFDDFDLRPLPLLDRKAALRDVLPSGQGTLLFVDHILGDGPALAAALARAGLRRGLARRGESPYRSGPSPDWRLMCVDPGEEAATLPVYRALERDVGPTARSPVRRVRPTNVDKVYWPREGFTKGDLLAYYASVADLLLPHLADRPVHMLRCPDGIDGPRFYQRHPPEHLPSWIRKVDVTKFGTGAADEGEATTPAIVCEDRDTLLYLANLGSIDLHAWISRVASLDHPDWAVLDLDPPAGVPFVQVARLAREIRSLLERLGLRSYPKTSGASGLHVYVPLAPVHDFEQARMFCEAVALMVVREHRDIATVERSPSRRGGRIYLDCLQNRRGATMAPPYVVRPVAGASVSTPLDWDEVDDSLHPSRFTIRTAPPRFAERGDLFGGVLQDRQDLRPAIAELARVLGPG